MFFRCSSALKKQGQRVSTSFVIFLRPLKQLDEISGQSFSVDHHGHIDRSQPDMMVNNLLLTCLINVPLLADTVVMVNSSC